MSHFFRGTTLGLVLGLGLGCVEQAQEEPTDEDLTYIKQHLLSAPPKPQLAVNADLDGKVTYLGLDVSPTPLEAGRDVRLVHYWQVVEAPGQGWRTFTHAGGPGGQGYINADHGPIRGKYPVAQWKAGDIIRDEHSFRLPNTWQPDKLEVYVGLWRGTTRMPVRSGPRDNQGRIVAASLPVRVVAPPAPPKKLLVRQIAKPLKIDGQLKEPAWKQAIATEPFVDTLTGAPGDAETRAKLLWDASALYIAFENVDTDVWSTLTKRDDKLWTQEAVEIFIDADGNGKSYVEFQVAPNGTLFDTYLPEYRKYENMLDPKRVPFDWNAKIRAGVTVAGTLNKRDDQDQGWTAEIAIPWTDVNGLDQAGAKTPPSVGTSWRVNLFRLDAPKGKPQKAVSWSPPLVGDFHTLARFGEIVFANDKGEVPDPAQATAPQPLPAHVKEALKTAMDGLQKPAVPGPGGAGMALQLEKMQKMQPGATAQPAKK
jgi:hypothetical protein